MQALKMQNVFMMPIYTKTIFQNMLLPTFCHRQSAARRAVLHTVNRVRLKSVSGKE